MNVKPLKKFYLVLVLLLASQLLLQAQEEVDHSYKPLTLKLDEGGQKYIRFIMWHQMWMTTNDLDAGKLQVTPSLRRSRFLAFAQVSPRFLILTHFGLNSLNPNNLTSLGGNGDAPQLFLHDAWTEFKVSDQLFIGGGLHYWKGMTRLANQSTLNFMTLDQSRPFAHWHSLGVTDQFARHLGIYAKGVLGDFDYRIALNSPGRSPLGEGRDYGLNNSNLTYTGASTINETGEAVGNSIIEGYFRYNVWNKESTKLPYMVGSYLGKKKVLSFGTGFFAHTNGMFNSLTDRHEGVFHYAFDAFMDLPTAAGGITAYASFQNFDYGDDYVSRWAGTGTHYYTHVGYYIRAANIMPYVAYQTANYQGFDENTSAFDVGINYYVLGHHAKITLEYHQISNDPREETRQIRLQAHIFL